MAVSMAGHGDVATDTKPNRLGGGETYVCLKCGIKSDDLLFLMTSECN